MDVFEAIRERRSTKTFDPNHTMSEEETRKLLHAARLSPTAFNLQHWRFLIVEDPELRKQIRALSWGQSQVTDASLLIILCADMHVWAKDFTQLWQNAPEKVQASMLRTIPGFYEGNPQLIRDEAMRSCGIAAQTLMLAAKGMGYDSCPMDGFQFEEVAKLIRLPEDHLISMFVTVGKSLEPHLPRPGRVSDEVAILRDRFPDQQD